MLAEPSTEVAALEALLTQPCLKPQWAWVKERRVIVCTCCERGYASDYLFFVAAHLRAVTSSNTYHPRAKA